MSTARRLAIVPFAAFASMALAAPQVVELISVSTSGGFGNGDCYGPEVTDDGRFVVFLSTASNLVAPDSNGPGPNLFLRDRQVGTTEIVSLSTAGVQHNAWGASVSSAGRYVAFASVSAIETTDTDTEYDIWVRDRLAGTTQQVSPDADGFSYTRPRLSADGRFLTYSLEQNAGVSIKTGIVIDDLQSGQDFRFEASYNQGSASGTFIGYPRISADGAWVLVSTSQWYPNNFLLQRISTATGIWSFVASNDQELKAEALSPDGQISLFMKDNGLHLFDHASGSSGGVASLTYDDQQVLFAFSSGLLSGDGRYVGFLCSATNMVQGGNSSLQMAYLRDRTTGTTLRVGLNAAQAPLNSAIDSWDLTANADLIVFETSASNVLQGDFNAKRDIFLRQNCLVLFPDADGDGFGAPVAGTLQCLPGPLQVQNTADCDDANASISPQAIEVCNGVDDDCDLQVDEGVAGTNYCLPKFTSSGCTPSISASGTPSVGAPGLFVISATQLEPDRNGIQFFGTTGPASSPFQGGTLCVNAPLYRLPVKTTGGQAACSGSLSYTLADSLAHPLGGPLLVPGASVHQQGWFRDPFLPIPVALTNGLAFQICP